MSVFRIAAIVMSFSALSFADTLKMQENLEGENQPHNKIWAQRESKSGKKTCQSWQLSCPREKDKTKQKCKACVVKYLTATERLKRKLTWDEKTKIWLDAKGIPYDTARENAKYNLKASTRYELEALEKWGIDPCIWVMDTQGNLYVSAEQSPGKFHHSSFLAGGLVEGAGQVVFVDGKITHINNASGHYRPDIPSFRNVLEKLHLSPEVGKDESEIVEYDKHSSVFVSKTNIRPTDSSSDTDDEDDESSGYQSNLDYYEDVSSLLKEKSR